MKNTKKVVRKNFEIVKYQNFVQKELSEVHMLQMLEELQSNIVSKKFGRFYNSETNIWIFFNF